MFGFDANLKVKRREVESSVKVVVKVGRIRLYSEVAEKVGQTDLYVSNLLAFLEDSKVKAVAKRIEVINITKVTGKLDSQNSEVLDSQTEALEVKQVPLAVSSLGKLIKRLRKRDLSLVYRQVLRS